VKAQSDGKRSVVARLLYVNMTFQRALIPTTFHGTAPGLPPVLTALPEHLRANPRPDLHRLIAPASLAPSASQAPRRRAHR
jgi:hypothetical protein